MGRPAAVTLIAVIAISVGGVSLFSKLYVLLVPDAKSLFFALVTDANERALMALPAGVHLGLGIIGSAVWVTGGVYLFRARNWARWLVIFWGLLIVILTFVSVGFSLPLYLKSATYLLMVFFLVTPSAASYFRHSLMDK